LPVRWKEEENQILEQLWGKCSLSEIAKVLMDRTEGAIYRRAHDKGLDKKIKPKIDYKYLKNLEKIHEI
jgi:hypothetical protein